MNIYALYTPLGSLCASISNTYIGDNIVHVYLTIAIDNHEIASQINAHTLLSVIAIT